jgi:hypothetical protein
MSGMSLAWLEFLKLNLLEILKEISKIYLVKIGKTIVAIIKPNLPNAFNCCSNALLGNNFSGSEPNRFMNLHRDS